MDYTFILPEQLTPKSLENGKTLIYLGITKNEVNHHDLRRIDHILGIFKQCGIKAREKLLLTFEGYDNVRKEVYQIGEIHDWCTQLIYHCPYLFYFLNTDINFNSGVFMACISNITTTQTKNSLIYHELESSIEKNEEWPKIKIQGYLDENLRKLVVSSTIDYGSSIGDHFVNVLQLLSKTAGLVV